MDRFSSFFTFFGICFLVSCSPVFDPREGGVETQLSTISSMAMTYGAQCGLAWKAKEINKVLEDHADELDRIYNFNSLMMKNNMLPPVVQQAYKTLTIEDHDKIRLADREVEIVRPAILATVAPSWRDYLIQSYDKPELLDKNIQLNTKEERVLWTKSFRVGWAQGIKQSSEILAQSLGVLNRDFNGMLLYHSLLSQNMITAAHTAKANLGVTGNETRMRINDQVLRITEKARLNPENSDVWNAVVVIDKSQE